MGQNPYWSSLPLPARIDRRIYGDRLVECFAERQASVYSLLQHAARDVPDTTAVVCGDSRLTYAELHGQVCSVAQALAGMGLNRGDRVIVLLSNRPEFVVALFAIQLIGAIAVPVSIREQRAGVTYMANQCAARAVFADQALAHLLPTGNDAPTMEHRVLVGRAEQEDGAQSIGQTADWDKLLRTRPDNIVPAQTGEQDTAVILYTSGTTGKPKGAMLTHLGIVHSAMHFIHCMQLPAQVRCVMAVPASHVTGLVANIITTVAASGTLVIMPQFKAAQFLQVAEQERCQFTVMVPAMYQLCLMQPDHRQFDLSAWTAGGYGGAPMPESTIDELAQWLPDLGLMNAYGATETTSPATLMPAHLTRTHADSVGVALPCAKLKVIDDAGVELAPGEIGEICIAGPMVVPGYWDNPDATASEFVGGYWHSGDLGRIDEHGFVYVLDRKKDMLNRGGYKIFSVEVENVLMSADAVSEAAVIGKPCPVLGERVHAVVCATPGRITESELRTLCAEKLADYKVPESVLIQSDPLPRNANGKILKRVLRDQLMQR